LLKVRTGTVKNSYGSATLSVTVLGSISAAFEKVESEGEYGKVTLYKKKKWKNNSALGDYLV
jgi:hypothetical protein